MRRPKAERRRFSSSAEISHKTITHVPADAKLRPLRDVLIVEPTERQFSQIIEVINECKPIRGVVRAAGPGCYPKRYNHAEKNKRTKMWDSKAFRPTECKVGDLVELGGEAIGGYAFDTFYHGEKLMLICREEDVCFVREAA